MNKSKDKNTLSKIEEEFDKRFPSEFIQMLPDGNHAMIETRGVTVKAIKSFYRQQILALLREVEREVIGEDDKNWIDKCECAYMECHCSEPYYQDLRKQQRAILQRKIKEFSL